MKKLLKQIELKIELLFEKIRGLSTPLQICFFSIFILLAYIPTTLLFLFFLFYGLLVPTHYKRKETHSETAQRIYKKTGIELRK